MARVLLLASSLLAVACAHGPAAAPAPQGFRIDREPDDEEAALQVARVLPVAIERAERWGRLSAPIVVRIQPTSEALAAAAGRPGDTWLRGWARRGSVDVQSSRSWSRGHASDAALATLLAHELTHCLLFQRIGAGWTHRDVPPWFEEGMASFSAGERHSRADASALAPGPAGRPFDAALAYGTADRAFHYLVTRHGEEAVRGLINGLAAGQDFAVAFQGATGTTVAAFQDALRAHLEAATAAR